MIKGDSEILSMKRKSSWESSNKIFFYLFKSFWLHNLIQIINFESLNYILPTSAKMIRDPIDIKNSNVWENPNKSNDIQINHGKRTIIVLGD